MIRKKIRKKRYYLKPSAALPISLLTVLAAIGLGFLVGQIEDVGQLLLDGGNAAGVLAPDYIGDLSGKL